MRLEKVFVISVVALLLVSVIVTAQNENNGNAHDNLQNLFLEISDTSESPLALKRDASSLLYGLALNETDSNNLEKINEAHMRISESIAGEIWYNESIIWNESVFTKEKEAGQSIRILIDRERRPEVNQTVLVPALIKLVQADDKLARFAIEEAEAALQLLVNLEDENLNEVVQNITTEVGLARDAYDRAWFHIRRGFPVVAIEFFKNAWEHAFSSAITVDRFTAPEVEIQSPLNGSYTRIAASTLNGSVVDVRVYTIREVAITHNAEQQSIPLVNGFFTKDLTLVENDNVINVSVRDIFENVGSSQVLVILDTIPPEVTISGVENGAFYNHDVSANIKVFDLHLDHSEVTLNGNSYSDGAVISTENENFLTAFAIDKAGNENSAAVSFVIDKTLPVVHIANPRQDSYVRSLVEITGTASDRYLDETELFIDGVKVSDSLPFTWDTTSYMDGKHSVTLRAVDKAGNTGETSIEVTVDNTPPQVNITKPDENRFVRQVVTIIASIIEVNIDKIEVFLNNTYVSTILPFELNTTLFVDGAYALRVYVSDLAGNQGYATRIINIDNTPPVLNVTELTENPTLLNPRYVLQGTTEETASVTINGNAIQTANGSFEFVTNVTQGTNTFNIVATDIAGNPSNFVLQRLVDSDLLPDFYEINVLGTDPLDGDSNSVLTLENEAGNGILDSDEVFDSSGLSSDVKRRIGADPFDEDTDDDGLVDNFEVTKLLLWYKVDKSDSDDDGISDAEEDLDADGLTNIQEFNLHTNPLKNDTDSDAISDKVEVELKTNPNARDSDSDGLEDDSEVALGTNPLTGDSDGDGTRDGDELFYRSIQGHGAEITMIARGDAAKFTRLVDNGDMVQVPGIHRAVELETRAFSSATLRIFYNESELGNLTESSLRMFSFNEEKRALELVESQVINTQENYVEAPITHASTYGVFDYSQWQEAFNSVLSPNKVKFTSGETIRIKVRVHNARFGTARNVEAKVYHGTSTAGQLIGTITYPEILGLSSTTESVLWRVPLKPTSIFVKVDPDNLVVELDETNNEAVKAIDEKQVDSDSDGLSDYDEVNGMRTGLGVIVRTNPNNVDTDGDGLSDGEEMGAINWPFTYYSLKSYPDKVDSDSDGLNDNEEDSYLTGRLKSDSDFDGIKDGIEVKELRTNALKSDTDGDGRSDSQEIADATDPLKFDEKLNALQIGGEFLLGTVTGEGGYWLADHGLISNQVTDERPYFLSGWIVAGLVPGVGDILDVKDGLIYLGEGELGEAGLSALSAIPLVGTVGDIGQVGNQIRKAVSRGGNAVGGMAKWLLRGLDKLPGKWGTKTGMWSIDNLQPSWSFKIVDGFWNGAGSALLKKGATQNDVLHIAKQQRKLSEVIRVAQDSAGRTRWLEAGTDAFGWAHIRKKHITGEIPDGSLFSVFGSKTDAQIQEMIFQTVERPDRLEEIAGSEIKYWKKFQKPDGTFGEIRVAVSDRVSEGIGRGNIITAFPD